MQPEQSLLMRSNTAANSPGEGAEVVGSCEAWPSFSKNSSSVRSTLSLKLSLPKSTFSGTTSMPQRSRHCAGRSAVESVTTPNPRLLDAEDEGIVLLPAGLKLDLQAGETVSQGRREALDLGIRRLLSAVHGDQLEGLRTERIERFLGDLVVLVAGAGKLVVD